MVGSNLTPGGLLRPNAEGGLLTVKANAEASDMGTIKGSDRIAATLYPLGTWFVSGIYV
jgi:hypothetical protein